MLTIGKYTGVLRFLFLSFRRFFSSILIFLLRYTCCGNAFLSGASVHDILDSSTGRDVRLARSKIDISLGTSIAPPAPPLGSCPPERQLLLRAAGHLPSSRVLFTFLTITFFFFFFFLRSLRVAVRLSPSQRPRVTRLSAPPATPIARHLSANARLRVFLTSRGPR